MLRQHPILDCVLPGQVERHDAREDEGHRAVGQADGVAFDEARAIC